MTHTHYLVLSFKLLQLLCAGQSMGTPVRLPVTAPQAYLVLGKLTFDVYKKWEEASDELGS